MEGEEKRNGITTRQHVLLPVFVSAHYVLPVLGGGGGGDMKKK